MTDDRKPMSFAELKKRFAESNRQPTMGDYSDQLRSIGRYDLADKLDAQSRLVDALDSTIDQIETHIDPASPEDDHEAAEQFSPVDEPINSRRRNPTRQYVRNQEEMPTYARIVIDWNLAPSWANFHTFDEELPSSSNRPTGQWWQFHPYIAYQKYFWQHGRTSEGTNNEPSHLHLPPNVDWKLSLQIRPPHAQSKAQHVDERSESECEP